MTWYWPLSELSITILITVANLIKRMPVLCYGSGGRQFLEIMVAKAGVPSLVKGLQQVPQDLFPPCQLPARASSSEDSGTPPSVGMKHLGLGLASIGRVDLGGGVLFLSCSSSGCAGV